MAQTCTYTQRIKRGDRRRKGEKEAEIWMRLPVSRYWNLEANGPVCSTGLTSSLLRSAGRHTS